VKELKRVSNTWIREHFPHQSQFEWQSGYGAFSVSQSQLENVIQYIIGQVEHHREVSFQDELRSLLQRHGLEWDERYVWD